MNRINVNIQKTLTSNSTSIPAGDLKAFLNGIPNENTINFTVQYGDRPGEGNTLRMSVEMAEQDKD